MKDFIKTLIVLPLIASCSAESGTQNIIDDSPAYPPNSAVVKMGAEGGSKLINIMNDDQMWDSICIGYKGNMSDYDNNPYTVKKSEILCDETTKDIKGPWFSFSHTDNPREMLITLEANKARARKFICEVFGENKKRINPWIIDIEQTEAKEWASNIVTSGLRQDTVVYVHNEAERWNRVKCYVDGEFLEACFENSEAVKILKGPWFTIENTDKANEVKITVEQFDNNPQKTLRQFNCYFSYEDEEEPWEIIVTQVCLK